MWQSATFALSNDLYDLYNVIQGLFQQQGWQSRYFDDLLRRAAREQDPKRRANLYDQAEKFAVQTHAVAIPLWATSQLSLIKPYVRGLREDTRSIWLHTWEYVDIMR
jgi:ABC-type oligopeptide transport system substrate-binding subunit